MAQTTTVWGTLNPASNGQIYNAIQGDNRSYAEWCEQWAAERRSNLTEEEKAARAEHSRKTNVSGFAKITDK